MHNALHKVWPGSTIRGCYFHYKQCLWRKLQAYELTSEYKVVNSPIRRSFKQIGALPFICPGSVEHVWSLLKPNIPSDMAEFVDYFERTWIGTSSTSPLFDHWLWNHYDTVLAGLPRSNNIVEGWHNGFQQLVGHSNPNIWMNREAPPLQPKKWRLYNQRLDAVVEDYDNYTDPLDYLKCVGELLYT